MIIVSCGIKIFAAHHSVLSQCTRLQTDGQNYDRITVRCIRVKKLKLNLLMLVHMVKLESLLKQKLGLQLVERFLFTQSDVLPSAVTTVPRTVRELTLSDPRQRSGPHR